MIKLKNYDKEKQKLSFVTDISVGLANAIRRSVLEIPVIAVDEVEIIKNDSALYDEIIAHRIGLVPIKLEKGVKEAKFKIIEKGPKTVYSTDIKPGIGTSYKIPLVVLDKDQELEVVCEARPGKGIEHAKYSPGLVYFSYNLDHELLDFVYVDENGKVFYDENDSEFKKLDEEKKKRIKELKEVKEIVFNVESWGQIAAKEIFLKAIEALDKNLDELNDLVK